MSELETRDKTFRLFLAQGIFAFVVLVTVSVLRAEETGRIWTDLGGDAPVLILLSYLFAVIVSLLRFELTNLIYVSMVIVAVIATFPILGPVLSSWTAVAAALTSRILAMKQIGPIKIVSADRAFEYVNAFRLLATYGVPVMIGSLVYIALGGHPPHVALSAWETGRLAIGGIALILSNTLFMDRVMRAYGYDVTKRFELARADVSIYILALPYAICMTYAYARIGLGALIALAFTAILINFVARNLAEARRQTRHQLQRLASLSNIGKTISLQFTTEELLSTIYTECKKVVDVSLFSIALLDEATNDLSFEFDVADDKRLPKQRYPIGEGLNSWVVQHHAPLLIASTREERRLGLRSVHDGIATESWLGVPMVSRDRVIGVISVQSYKKNAFTKDDVLLLTAIANQAAVALENAQLYKDLEGLTSALEHRVLERTNELRETNLRLMAADRSKNQFLANMSHELRTPLNSIIGFSSVLLENAKELLTSRRYKFLENIHVAGTHLLDLINDILDLSKIEAGKMELRPELFDIRDTLAAVERVMRGYASEMNVTIATEVEANVPKVLLDEGRLKQILFNLLSNAIKFSPSGGPVTVHVSRVDEEESPIHCDSVMIAIRDSGIGMAEEELRKIFDEFYQTEEGRRTRKGGTGLGLSLARNFVELHRGTIEVESAPGKGSTFTLYLPVRYEAASMLPSELPTPMLRL